MLRIYKTVPLLLLFLLAACDDNQFTDIIDDNWIQEPEVCDDDTTSVSFKKVAYWTPDDDENYELVDFSKLTHIIYAPISVDADGSVPFPEGSDEDALEYLVVNSGINVLVSLGDGEDNNFNTIAESSSITKNFASEVIDIIDEYELDGVEINWQTIGSDDESDNLEDLLEKLREELDEEYGEGEKLLTMTVPSGEYSSADNIDNDLFAYVDFVNVMALDSTDSDDLHSSMQDAEEAITYWIDRCLIQNKLVLAVPFYSAGNAVRSYDYLIRDDISYACVDESERRDYNGIPTVMDKTNYALLYAGGIIMKSLEQDYYERSNDDIDYSEYSLLNVINETSNGDYVDLCD